MPQPHQPFLHDLVCSLAVPTQAWSAYDGQIGSAGKAVGAQGVLHADLRVLSAAELLVQGRRPEHIATGSDGAEIRFAYVFRDASWLSGSPDERVRIDRVRRVAPGRVDETEAHNSTADPRALSPSKRTTPPPTHAR